MIAPPLIVLLTAGVSGSAPRPGSLTIDRVVELALERHPALRASAAEQQDAAARVKLARAAELPHADASVEVVAGTGNVLRGPLYGLGEIPAVTGPPLPSSFGEAALGTALSLGASWDVLALRQRIAESDAALLELDRARASTEALRLRTAFRAADAFIVAEAAHEDVQVAQADVERAQVLTTSVAAVVAQALKPGADLARAQAELALAKTRLARAQQADAVAGAQLAEAVGVSPQPIIPEAGRLAELPVERSPAPTGAANPELVLADASVSAAKAAQRSVGLQYWPRLEIVASLWARGSGLASGSVGASAAAGLAPNTPNWAAGAVLDLPLFDLAAIRAREDSAAAKLEVERWNRAEVAEEIEAQLQIAKAGLDSALEVARNAAVAAEAAQISERQAEAQYKAGLGSIVEVAEAQRLLARAAGEEVAARLGLWRARLDLARAQGDLGPFLADATGRGAR